MRQHFTTTYDTPQRSYAFGVSLGGHIALATIEQPGSHYDGVLSICGANLPALEFFDKGVVTPLLALDYFFPEALALPRGLVDPSAPPMVDLEIIKAALKKNEAVASILVERFEIPRTTLADAMAFKYMLLKEMQQRAGGHPVNNQKTVYSGFGDDVAFNKGVRRYADTPDAMAYVQRNANLSGRINNPVVLLSNVIDQYIQPRFTNRYPELARSSGRDDKLAVLPFVGEGHCIFTPEQVGVAFDALVKWVEHGQKPAAQ